MMIFPSTPQFPFQLPCVEVSFFTKATLALGVAGAPSEAAGWVAFGFKKPGARPTPDIPEGVTAILIGPTAVSVKWLLASRANHYRIWKRVIGEDAELVPVGTSSDLDFTIIGLPTNAEVEIAVSAVNHGGESALSQLVLVTTG